mgnify:CR=1 FL=1
MDFIEKYNGLKPILLIYGVAMIVNQRIFNTLEQKALSYLFERKEMGYVDTNKLVKHYTPPPDEFSGEDSQPLIAPYYIKKLIDKGYINKIPTMKYSKKIMITEKGIERLKFLNKELK